MCRIRGHGPMSWLRRIRRRTTCLEVRRNAHVERENKLICMYAGAYGSSDPYLTPPQTPAPQTSASASASASTASGLAHPNTTSRVPHNPVRSQIPRFDMSTNIDCLCRTAWAKALRCDFGRSRALCDAWRSAYISYTFLNIDNPIFP